MIASRLKCVKLSSLSRVVVQARPLSTYKTSTGLVGLPVDPNGRETLRSLAAQVLTSVKKIPEDSQYRENVEKWFNFITKVTTEKDNILDIENEIDLGQIEEVIGMAKDELKLIDYYYDNKGWELVEQAKKQGDKIVEEMADSIYFSSPEARASYVKPSTTEAK